MKTRADVPRPDVPYGHCHCGCGQKTPPATTTQYGNIKGEPTRYVSGHTSRWFPPPDEGMKWCRICFEQKPKEEFWKSGKTSDGLQSICRNCSTNLTRQWREKNEDKAYAYVRFGKLLRKFGLLPEEYEAMLEAQNHLCAVCGKPESKRRRKTGVICQLSVDHDHATGKIRQLLCHSCNAGLGALGDDPALLQKAMDYLRRHGK